jgi:hypothetical protein
VAAAAVAVSAMLICSGDADLVEVALQRQEG